MGRKSRQKAEQRVLRRRVEEAQVAAAGRGAYGDARAVAAALHGRNGGPVLSVAPPTYPGEPPSRVLSPLTELRPCTPDELPAEVYPGAALYYWECPEYSGHLRKYATGSPFAPGGAGPYVVMSIAAADNTARHDWREFQQLKTMVLGADWWAFEVYPAEGRLVDPSNMYYLWAYPPDQPCPVSLGVKCRHVLQANQIPGQPPQRAYPPGYLNG